MKTKTKIYAIIATIMTACYAVLIALSVWNLSVQMKINALKSDGRNVMYTDAAAFAEVCDEIDYLKTLKAWNFGMHFVISTAKWLQDCLQITTGISF